MRLPVCLYLPYGEARPWSLAIAGCACLYAARMVATFQKAGNVKSPQDSTMRCGAGKVGGGSIEGLFYRVSCLALVGITATTRAYAAGVEIHWQAPIECGTKAHFEAGVSRTVGKPISELESSWTSADILISRRRAGWSLLVRVRADNGTQQERAVATTTCHEAEEAAELIVATNLSSAPSETIDEQPASSKTKRGKEPKEEESASQAGVRPPPERVRQDDPTSDEESVSSPRTRQKRHSVSVLVGVRAGLEPLLLPAPEGLGWAVVGLRAESWKVEASVAATTPEMESIAGGGSVRASLIASDVLGCLGGRALALRILGCGGAEAGRFVVAGGSGSALVNPRTRRDFWFAALVQGEISWPLSEILAVAAGVQGVVATRQIRVVRSNPQTGNALVLYSTGVVDVRPWLGLELAFR
jgi:hypothetical protein